MYSKKIKKSNVFSERDIFWVLVFAGYMHGMDEIKVTKLSKGKNNVQPRKDTLWLRKMTI